MPFLKSNTWLRIVIGISFYSASLPSSFASPPDTEILPAKTEKIWKDPKFGSHDVEDFSGPTRQVTKSNYYSSKNGLKENVRFYEKMWGVKAEEVSGYLSSKPYYVLENSSLPDVSVSIISKEDIFCLEDKACEQNMRGAKSVIILSRRYAENFSENLRQFKWTRPSDREKYAAMTWDSIQMPALQGFHSRWPMVLKGDCVTGPETQSYLYQASGLCNYSTWLEIDKSGKIERIDSVEKLKPLALPLNNAQAAASFLYVTGKLPRTNKEEISAFALKVPEGFLLQSRVFPGFGCSDVSHEEAVFLVTPAGETTKVASRVWRGESICID